MFRFALRNLLSRPMRSLLSLLGLTVAIVGMVGLFSVARGLDRLISSTFDKLHGLIAMQPGAPVPLFSRLPAKWGDEIGELPGVSQVSAEVWARVNVIDEKMILSPPRFLFGTHLPSRLKLKQKIYQDDIVEGRFLTLEDRGTMNAVISRQIAEEFDKGVGDVLTVNGADVTIVGVYHCGSLLLDIAIILDIEQVRAMTRFDADSVSSFYIEPDASVDEETLAKRIPEAFRGRAAESTAWLPSAVGAMKEPSGGGGGAELLRFLGKTLFGPAKPAGPAKRDETKRDAAKTSDDAASSGESSSADPEKRGATTGTAGSNKTPSGTAKSGTAKSRKPPGGMKVEETGPIEVRSVAGFAQRIDKFSDDLDIFLSVLTSIGVTIAVLSIVNTMLMSVTERIIEFGILKANGWTKTDVLKLVTFESGILGLGGGVLGALFGWGGTHFINAAWPTRVTLYASPGLLAFSVAFSTAMGVLGGLYPALWAMRLMPMDAIRRG